MKFTSWQSIPPLLIMAAIAIAAAIYAPGLSGPWLVDDDFNLGMFNNYSPGQAPYMEIISNNNSGPLGRMVSMASFAANHALNLFSTTALKSTNLLIHLCNGLLVFLLLSRLLRRKPTANTFDPSLTAAVIAIWWILLPIHLSSVLYIVQRMTLLASFFSLAACLAYAIGRDMHTRNPRLSFLLIGTSLSVLFPLAVFSKESAFVTLAWLILIETFFFSHPPVWRIGIRNVVLLLVAGTILAGALLATFLPITSDYIWREFTLNERLITQSRVIWSYIRTIFLPNSTSMGLFHDDYTLSVGFLRPWTTLPALIGIAALFFFAVKISAGRFWAVSFGLLFYFSGHLVESTIVPLELYFEHRNYLPSLGLLLAASSAASMLWPFKRPVLVAVFVSYLCLLSLSTFQRAQIWADKSILLRTSAQSHPKSLRAWTDYPENLLENRKPRLALEAALTSALRNPEAASISYIQMISIYCRIQEPVPPQLVTKAANALRENRNFASSFTTPMGIGLELVLTTHKNGGCAGTDFSPLAPALAVTDNKLKLHYGRRTGDLWFLRLTLAEWLIELQQPKNALLILYDIWNTTDRNRIPMAGLTLAKVLIDQGQSQAAQTVLAELATVTHDAPEDFRIEMASLQRQARDAK